MLTADKCLVGCRRPARRHRMCQECWDEVPAELRHELVTAFEAFKVSVRQREPHMRDRANAYRMARDAAIGSIR